MSGSGDFPTVLVEVGMSVRPQTDELAYASGYVEGQARQLKDGENNDADTQTIVTRAASAIPLATDRGTQAGRARFHRSGRRRRARRSVSVQLYHVTTAKNAEAIMRDGFCDRSGSYVIDTILTGVWLSDRPLDANEAMAGSTVLVVDLHVPISDLADYELIEEGKPYREWCVPADVARRIATVRATS